MICFQFLSPLTVLSCRYEEQYQAFGDSREAKLIKVGRLLVLVAGGCWWREAFSWWMIYTNTTY